MAIRDGDWTLISWDPRSGRSVWEFDHGDGRKTHRTDEPVDQLVSQNAEMVNNSVGKKWGEGQMTYSMPFDLWAKHFREAAQQRDRAYIQKKIKDDFSKFATFDAYLK